MKVQDTIGLVPEDGSMGTARDDGMTRILRRRTLGFGDGHFSPRHDERHVGIEMRSAVSEHLGFLFFRRCEMYEAM